MLPIILAFFAPLVLFAEDDGLSQGCMSLLGIEKMIEVDAGTTLVVYESGDMKLLGNTRRASLSKGLAGNCRTENWSSGVMGLVYDALKGTNDPVLQMSINRSCVPELGSEKPSTPNLVPSKAIREG